MRISQNQPAGVNSDGLFIQLQLEGFGVIFKLAVCESGPFRMGALGFAGMENQTWRAQN